MSNAKCPRGRPRGSGKDDTAALVQVANMLVHDPLLKPTTAMKRVMAHHTRSETDETLIRRWQVKWKQTGPLMLAAAQERARSDAKDIPTTFAQPGWMQVVKDLQDSPAVRSIKGLQEAMANSPIRQMMRQIEDTIVNSPVHKMMKQIEQSIAISPIHKRFKEIEESIANSPIHKRLREIEESIANSPVHKMMAQLAEDRACAVYGPSQRWR